MEYMLFQATIFIVLLQGCTFRTIIQDISEDYEDATLVDPDKEVHQTVTRVTKAPVAVRPSCPTHWRTHAGHCYYVTKGQLQQSDARAVCRSYGADLVDITSKEEQKYVFHLTRKRSHYDHWIGLDQKHVAGRHSWNDVRPQYTWLRTGEKATYHHWLRGAQGLSLAGLLLRRVCFTMERHHGGWKQADCRRWAPFVCKTTVMTSARRSHIESTMRSAKFASAGDIWNVEKHEKFHRTYPLHVVVSFDENTFHRLKQHPSLKIEALFKRIQQYKAFVANHYQHVANRLRRPLEFYVSYMPEKNTTFALAVRGCSYNDIRDFASVTAEQWASLDQQLTRLTRRNQENTPPTAPPTDISSDPRLSSDITTMTMVFSSLSGVGTNETSTAPPHTQKESLHREFDAAVDRLFHSLRGGGGGNLLQDFRHVRRLVDRMLGAGGGGQKYSVHRVQPRIIGIKKNARDAEEQESGGLFRERSNMFRNPFIW